MLVPSTFTGWYKNTMMTSARPMAIKRSRVQTRISLRKECSGSERSTLTVTSGCVLRKLAVVWPATATEGNAEARVSGDVDVAACFSFGVSIWATFSIYSMAIAGRARCDLAAFLTLGEGCRSLAHIEIRGTRPSLQGDRGHVSKSWKHSGCRQSRLFAAEGVVQGGQRGDNGGFRAQEGTAPRSLQETAPTSRREILLHPTALP